MEIQTIVNERDEFRILECFDLSPNVSRNGQSEELLHVLTQSFELYEFATFCRSHYGAQMKNECGDEKFFTEGDRLLLEVNTLLKDPRQFGVVVKLPPDLPVLFVDGYRIGNPPGFRVLPSDVRGQQKATDNADALKQIQPMHCKP